MKDLSNNTLYGAIAELKQIEEILDDENIEENKKIVSKKEKND